MAIKIVMLFCLVILKETYQYPFKKNPISFADDDSIFLYCADIDKELSSDTLKHYVVLSEPIWPKKITIDSCVPPSHKSFADVLKALNVNVSEIRSLHLLNSPRTEEHANHADNEGPDPRRPKKEHFADLDLEELQILNDGAPAALSIELNLIENLHNLKNLVFHNVDIFGTLTNTTKLERLEISGGMWYGDVGNCSSVKVLHLLDTHLLSNSGRYSAELRDCKQLEELKLERIESAEAKNLLVDLPKTLRNITVRHCRLYEFPYSYSLYEDTTSFTAEQNTTTDDSIFALTYLDASHNRLGSTGFLSSHKGLEYLDLSYNDIDGEIPYRPKVIDMKLDHNNMEEYCFSNRSVLRMLPDDYAKNTKIKRLSLSHTGLQELCFDEIELPDLEKLDVSHNSISVLNFRQLYKVLGHNFEVDLKYNPLEKVQFTQDDYELLKQNDTSVAHWRNIKILTTSRLVCDCSHAWFARAIREGLLAVEGATCIDGTSLSLPRMTYGLDGCAAACEGSEGCSAANNLHNIINIKDKVSSVVPGSLGWALDKIYNKIKGQ